MITRRSFLSLLACLPFVGRWVPKTEWRDVAELAFYPPLNNYPHLYPVPGVAQFNVSTHLVAVEQVVAVGDSLYVQTADAVYVIDRNTGASRKT